jgi:16S rRNA (cytosine1402-N4)-methyltransferase
VQTVSAFGGRPERVHPPIMLQETLRCLRPSAGDVAVDCTLGGGGHARAILDRVRPGGRLIGLDIDPLELPHTEARLRAAGYGPDIFIARHASFARLPDLLASEDLASADLIVADLGLSSMQADNPDRGFNYKNPGPLDMRMDPLRGEPASDLLERLTEEALVAILTDHADEPHAVAIASWLKRQPVRTAHALERLVRTGLNAAFPGMTKADVKMSVRRTFQALRIAVNDEFASLEALLRSLPDCLARGGRVAVLTFHSGEDRRVKQAFRAGRRQGVYSAVADEVIRSTKEETFANRRAAAAKLRWAVRAGA